MVIEFVHPQRVSGPGSLSTDVTSMGDTSDVLCFNVPHNKSPLALVATNIANYKLSFGVRIHAISEVYHGVNLLINSTLIAVFTTATMFSWTNLGFSSSCAKEKV